MHFFVLLCLENLLVVVVIPCACAQLLLIAVIVVIVCLVRRRRRRRDVLRPPSPTSSEQNLLSRDELSELHNQEECQADEEDTGMRPGDFPPLFTMNTPPVDPEGPSHTPLVEFSQATAGEVVQGPGDITGQPDYDQ